MRTKITSILVIVTLVAIVPPLNAHADSMPDEPISDLEFNLTGAGATFPFPLIDLWRVEYNKIHDNVNLNYQSIGSGEGIKQRIEQTVNFAASDKPMSEAERELAPGTLHIPESIGGVVLVCNLPEVPEKGMKLTSDIVGQEYATSLLYVPLADKIVEIGKQGLSQVICDGEILWDYEASADTGNLEIPQWVRDNAKWCLRVDN
ncbi:substrate-binding domain-containing protein [Nitrosopumilus sp.]|uniref:substrate-binding domain-containing protein n=1 Tax=Nitrosopumilus sp. TaxID=2024843 RepID=UPI003B5D02B3